MINRIHVWISRGLLIIHIGSTLVILKEILVILEIVVLIAIKYSNVYIYIQYIYIYIDGSSTMRMWLYQ